MNRLEKLYLSSIALSTTIGTISGGFKNKEDLPSCFVGTIAGFGLGFSLGMLSPVLIPIGITSTIIYKFT